MTALGLGCAQLGLRYGNSNQLMPEATAIGIVRQAYEGGIRFFDTARAYGSSEERISKAKLPKDAIICTKMKRCWPTIDANIIMIHGITNHIEVKALGRRVSDRAEFGASVYTLKQAEIALGCKYVKWLEVPINLVDRRFINPEFIARCRANDVKIVARSILLQGVLTSDPLPEVRKRASLAKLRGAVKASTADAFDFVFGNLADIVAVAIVGVQDEHQLRKNINIVASSRKITDLDRYDVASAYAEKHKLYDPRTWDI